MAGKAALMMLTGPKKLVSNWSRTRAWVRREAASSSTVPMMASLEQQKRMSSFPNAEMAWAIAAWHWPTVLGERSMSVGGVV